MLRIVTTADTEIMATAAAVERLPPRFPEVRCGNPGGVQDHEEFVDEVLIGARAVLRREICDRYVEGGGYRFVEISDPERDRRAPDYRAEVEAWRARRAALWEAAIRDELTDDGCGGFLVWGDPSLYDGTLAVLEQVRAAGNLEFEYEVVPGISSVQALAAKHRIALNRVGGGIQITTGRRLAEGFPEDADDVVVMLDGGCAFRRLGPAGIDIYWGAYIGTDDELLLAGELSEVADEIERAREEARGRKGWIMDTYLLRRHRPE